MSIESDIKKFKAQLIARAKKKGLYENFGQEEVRKLEDKYKCNTDYSDKGRENWKKLREFDEWCMNFDERKLMREADAV